MQGQGRDTRALAWETKRKAKLWKPRWKSRSARWVSTLEGCSRFFFGYGRRGFVGSCIRQRVLPARSGASAPCAPQRRRRLRQHSRRECHPAGTLRDSDTWLFALASQDTTLAENQTHAHRAADPSWNLPFPVTTSSLHSHRLQSHHAGITRDGVGGGEVGWKTAF